MLKEWTVHYTQVKEKPLISHDICLPWAAPKWAEMLHYIKSALSFHQHAIPVTGHEEKKA